MNPKNHCLFKSICLGAAIYVLQIHGSFAEMSDADNKENVRLANYLSQINVKLALDPKIPDVLSAKICASQLIYIGDNKELEDKWRKQKEEITKLLDSLEKALQTK